MGKYIRKKRNSMSDKQKKRYYWLKLKEDFFEEDTIAWLEEQPNGKEYCLFYLKLCLKSLKTEGILARNVGNTLIPYEPESLAKLTNSSADTVRVAMDLFQKIGLIQMMDSGEIYLSQLDELVGSETEYAKQKRLQRSKEKKTLVGQLVDNVQTLSKEKIEESHNTKVLDSGGQCPENVAQSIELEIEKEKELEIELQQEASVLASVITFQKLWLFPNEIQKDDLIQLINQYGDDLVDAAIKVAGKKDVPKGRAINFITACLKEWIDAGVKSVDDAREYQRRRIIQSKQSYGRPPVRKEALPEWADNPQIEDDKQVDPAVEARLQAYVAKQEQERLAREEEQCTKP